MEFFNALTLRVNDWANISCGNHFNITGPSIEQWPLFFTALLNNKQTTFNTASHLLILPTSSQAETLHQTLKDTMFKERLIYFPGLEVNPYLNIIPSEGDLYRRFRAMHKLANNQNPHIIISTFGNNERYKN